MESFFVLLIIGGLLALLLGGLMGFVAFLRQGEIQNRIQRLESEIRTLHGVLKNTKIIENAQPSEPPAQIKPDLVPERAPLPESTAPETGKETVPDQKPASPAAHDPDPLHPAAALKHKPESPVQPPHVSPPRTVAGPARKSSEKYSLEELLGTKWLGWAGILMLVIGVGYLMKYAYDHNMVSPWVRLMIGVAAGFGSLMAGHILRARGYRVLFNTLTGGGIAIFYICIYFAMRVYGMVSPSVAMGLAVLVTAGAIVSALANNSQVIAVLAVIGGFISPFLYGAEDNSPSLLFNYVIALDLAALVVAYFRGWRVLPSLSFWGTLLVYSASHSRFFDTGQMAPALLYNTIFFLIFLIAPLLHPLAKRREGTLGNLVLLFANALSSLSIYAAILLENHRPALGYVVLGQALLVFALYGLWIKRFQNAGKVGNGLLTIAVGLAALVVPISLKLYGVPLGWATQGVVLVYLGVHFGKTICRAGGVAILVFAVIALLERLPLHTRAFSPVLNGPFGSWFYVVAACGVAAALLAGRTDMSWSSKMSLVTGAVSFLTGALLLSLETFGYWEFHPSSWANHYQKDSMIVLWSLIPTAVTLVLWLKYRPRPISSLLPFAIGFVVFFWAMDGYTSPSAYPVNLTFLARFCFVAGLWLSAHLLRGQGEPVSGNLLEIPGHLTLVWLSAVELSRWPKYNESIDSGLGFVTAAWAVHALILIWLGLVHGNRGRRFLGFALFLLASGKTILIDLTEPLYKIVSFISIGLLALCGAYFYQRFRDKISGVSGEPALPSNAEEPIEDKTIDENG